MVYRGIATVRARFLVNNVHAQITFSKVSKQEWQVSIEVKADLPATEIVRSSIRVLSGVFQGVREFLEVRQPEVLLFGSKYEELSDLYETYLQRGGTVLAELGYEVDKASRVGPATGFSVRKRTPSAWVN